MSPDAEQKPHAQDDALLDDLMTILAQVFDQADWTYEADRTLTFKVPHGPLGDRLHEHLTEVGEPFE